MWWFPEFIWDGLVPTILQEGPAAKRKKKWERDKFQTRSYMTFWGRSQDLTVWDSFLCISRALGYQRQCFSRHTFSIWVITEKGSTIATIVIVTIVVAKRVNSNSSLSPIVWCHNIQHATMWFAHWMQIFLNQSKLSETKIEKRIYI